MSSSAALVDKIIPSMSHLLARGEKELLRRAFYFTQSLSRSVHGARFILRRATYTQHQLGIALITAAQKGRLHVVQLLCANLPLHSGWQSALVEAAFYQAAWKGRLEVVQFLLNTFQVSNIDVALLRAAKNGHLDVVQYLEENGANIHAQDEAPLRWAAGEGHLEVIRFLVSAGANITARRNEAFVWAAEGGHFAVVQFLVKKGVGTVCAAYRRAAAEGHYKVVQYLAQLHGGAYTSLNNEALVCAAKGGRLKVVKFLVQNEVKALQHDHAWYDRAIQGARHEKHYAIVRYLVERDCLCVG